MGSARGLPRHLRYATTWLGRPRASSIPGVTLKSVSGEMTPAPPRFKLQKQRILLVEDDVVFRDDLRELLEASGFEVECCLNGLAPLTHLRQRRFHLVVTNVRMPGAEGVGTTYEIKRWYPDLPILAMLDDNNYLMDHQRRMAELMGARGIIEKPFSWTSFLRVVERVVLSGGPPNLD